MRLIDIINRHYENSSSVTEEYKAAKRDFISVLKKMFKGYNVIIESCPHFEFTGFINHGTKYVYFSTDDLRWKSNMLVRTAKNDTDWTGGCNNFIEYNEDFDKKFKAKVEQLLTLSSTYN